MEEEHESAAPAADRPGPTEENVQPARPAEKQPQAAAPAIAGDAATAGSGGPSKRPKYRYALLVVYRGTQYHGLQMSVRAEWLARAGTLCVHPLSPQQSGHPHGGARRVRGHIQSWPHHVGQLGGRHCCAQGPAAARLAARWRAHTTPRPSVQTGLNRAARTDKGVHAAGQVITLKLMVEPEGEQEALDAINRHCPGDVRVISMVRVTKNFNAKSHCHRRTYEYFLPTFLVAPDPLSMVDFYQRGQHFCNALASSTEAAARLRRARTAGQQPPAPEEATVRVFSRKAPAPHPAPAPPATGATAAPAPEPAPEPVSEKRGAAPDKADPSPAASPSSPAPAPAAPSATPPAAADDDAGPPPRHDLTDRVAVASDTTRLPVGIDVDVAKAQQEGWPELYRYRIPPRTLAKLRAAVKVFTGTHNFHNYTRGKAPGDPRCALTPTPVPAWRVWLHASRPVTDVPFASCARFIIDCKVHSPEVVESACQRRPDPPLPRLTQHAAPADIEFVRLTVFGQSFMFNQIRKMVGS